MKNQLKCKLIAFDLDGTVWSPEMYELWNCGGSPFKIANKNGDVLTDKNNTKVCIKED